MVTYTFQMQVRSFISTILPVDAGLKHAIMSEIVQYVTTICSLLKYNKVSSRRLKHKSGE